MDPLDRSNESTPGHEASKLILQRWLNAPHSPKAAHWLKAAYWLNAARWLKAAHWLTAAHWPMGAK